MCQCGCVLALAACGRDILWFQLCYNHLQMRVSSELEGTSDVITKTATDINHSMGLVHLTLALTLRVYLVPSANVSFSWAHSLAPAGEGPAGPSLESALSRRSHNTLALPAAVPTVCITAISLFLAYSAL